MKKRRRTRFGSMYWRQLFVTAGMVLLTLALLGILFFSLSYRYANNQNNGEVEERTKNYILQFAREYLKEDTWFRTLPELRKEPEYQRLAAVSEAAAGIRILICGPDGRVLPEDAPETEQETEQETEPAPRRLPPRRN